MAEFLDVTFHSDKRNPETRAGTTGEAGGATGANRDRPAI